MEHRLQELREQFELGKQQLAQLDLRRDELRDNLLRLSGAIQVLEELVAQNGHQSVEETRPEAGA
jgi:hypothetical protein